jgi:hypothetical protein
MALFIRITIRLFRLVFSAETAFFSHNKSVNNIFQPAYQPNRMTPMWLDQRKISLDGMNSCLFTVCICKIFADITTTGDGRRGSVAFSETSISTSGLTVTSVPCKILIVISLPEITAKLTAIHDSLVIK